MCWHELRSLLERERNRYIVLFIGRVSSLTNHVGNQPPIMDIQMGIDTPFGSGRLRSSM